MNLQTKDCSTLFIVPGPASRGASLSILSHPCWTCSKVKVKSEEIAHIWKPLHTFVSVNNCTRSQVALTQPPIPLLNEICAPPRNLNAPPTEVPWCWPWLLLLTLRNLSWRQANPNNLRPVPISYTTSLSIPIGLWNCPSAVNKAEFIYYIATHSGLNLKALTETWIKPEDTATLAALSTNFTCSHTPCTIGRGGTGLLISNYWKFDLLPSLPGNSSFESHAITITHPVKIHFVVVYRPPGQLGNSLEELDVLLSNLPEDGTPLVLLGDFNIHLEKPQAADFNTLLQWRTGHFPGEPLYNVGWPIV